MTQTIVASCWTTAGQIRSGDMNASSRLDLRARVAAAARAGFDGMGLNQADLSTALDQFGARTLRAIFEDHGIRFLELEVLTDWYSTGEQRAQFDELRHLLLTAAEELGADVIKAIGRVGGTRVDPDLVAAELRTLAEQASRAGTRVSIESSPVFDLRTPADVLDVVERADHPAAGVHLDVWQIVRAGVPIDELRNVPAHRIGGVDLSDGLAEPLEDIVSDCFDHRGVPGGGGLDVIGFVRAVQATGYDGAWSVEVLDADYRRLPLPTAVASAYAGTVEVMSSAARSGLDPE